MRTRIAVGIAGSMTLLFAAGCTGGPAAVESSSSPAQTAPSTTNPYGAVSIDPAAPDEPVLTVQGGSTPLSLTLEQLNALGDVSITIDEPFVKQRQTFRGVPLAAVLAEAGVPENATIDTVAINDYHYADDAATMVGSQALIATERDGAPIPYDQGGPIRLVYPDGSALSRVLDAWNWSLTTITVLGQQPPAS
ncbi:MAG: molybdopterin-dependent oxidoreductase [Mycobacterium sp.]|nr:molybdopterin-dependent oxidoreductase [Mycobacterium sp.]